MSIKRKSETRSAQSEVDSQDDNLRSRSRINGNAGHVQDGVPKKAPQVLVRDQKETSMRPVLITGGAGFIGTNLAHRLLSSGRHVILYDNLSRAGVEQNVAWLKQMHGSDVQLVKADVRDAASLREVVAECGQAFHFAAQVAVTTSLANPTEDFEINARGTLNLLEALRGMKEPPALLFTSTNKVYGEMSDVKLRARDGRYEPVEERLRRYGFDESCPLHFHSPYGCSKGAACQYVQDYARTFGLRTAVFRMSCIYGPHQFGTEDQGWVAHFLIQALAGAPITLYGDGRQVRDVLFVEDLVDAFLLAHANMDRVSGQAFNIGGGPRNTTSLLELIDHIAELDGKKPEVHFADWRPADQQYYVSDTRRFSALTGWSPKITMRAGVAKLHHWLQEFGGTSQQALLLDDLRMGAVLERTTSGKAANGPVRTNGRRNPRKVGKVLVS